MTFSADDTYIGGDRIYEKKSTLSSTLSLCVPKDKGTVLMSYSPASYFPGHRSVKQICRWHIGSERLQKTRVFCEQEEIHKDFNHRRCQEFAKQKKDTYLDILYQFRQRLTFPGSRPPSIISAKELNYCVRDGNRCPFCFTVEETTVQGDCISRS